MFAKIQKLLQKSHNVPSSNPGFMNIEFYELQHAKEFVTELLKVNFDNNTSNEPKKIKHKWPDLEKPRDRYIIELTMAEWNVLQQDGQSLLKEKQHTIPVSQTLAAHGLFAKLATSGYEDHQHKEDELLKGIDLDRLIGLIGLSRKRVKPAKKRDLVLLMGRTGAGKSTTLNYLMGSRMVVDESGLEQRLDVAEGQPVYAEIGHSQDSGDSKTLHPQVVPLREFPDELAYCDCPGFADNRTREEKLCSSVGLPMAISYARAIRAMIVVIDCADLTAARGEGFVSLAKTLGQLLKDPETLLSKREGNTPSNFLFVFTKVPEGKKAAQIIGAIENKKKTFTERLKKLASDAEKITQELTRLLGVSEILSHARADQERLLIISKMEETIANLSEETARIARGFYERLSGIQAELEDLETQLSIYNSILANRDNVFIVRGDELDDKPRIIKTINQLRKIAPIPKEQFVLDGGKGGEWNVLDKIIQKITEEGARLLSVQTSYPAELATLKKYKKLVEKQRADQERILQNLKSSKLSQNDLKKLCEEVLNMNGELTKHLNKTLEQKQVEKKQLEKELQELDTAEPTRYRHRNLEPVSFEMKPNMQKVLYGMSVPLGLALLPVSLTLIAGGAIGGGIAKLLQKSGLNVPKRTIYNIMMQPVLKFTLPINKAVSSLLNVSHHFQYDDLPFIDIKRKSNPELDVDTNIWGEESEDEHVAIQIMEDHFNKMYKYPLGFDLRNEIKNPIQGKYEITYRNMHGENDYNGPLTVWIELFVEKRIHPDFKPRIEIIKKQLERLELMMSGYLEHDPKQLMTTLEEEKKLLKGVSKEEELQSRLRNILEKRLSQHQRRMEVLHSCILGYQAKVRESRRELVRQKPRYNILAQLAEVMGVNQFVKTFLSNYVSYLKQGNPTQLITVWGRKQTPDRQPDYEVQEAKIEGMSIGAFFKLRDKPSNFWLGKLSYRSFSTTESPQSTPASRARRGSSFESVKEKIAADLYSYLSDGQYLVPKTRLAELPIENKFTRSHPLTKVLLEEINKDRQQKINEGVYVMSKRVENYQDLAELNGCVIDDELFKFEQCLTQGKLPEQVMIENRKIPLKGVMEILAVSRLLADTDALGGSAKNTGFLIECDTDGKPIAVRAVKVDPGYAFNFEGAENLLFQSHNPLGSTNNLLKKDKRHLQYGNMAKPLPWNNLSPLQREQFILALDFGLKTLRDNDAVIEKFFIRKAFEKTPKQRDLPKVEEYLKGLQKNLDLQEEAYKKELDELRKLSQESCFIPPNH